jgi:fumarate hydratase subunit alpha
MRERETWGIARDALERIAENREISARTGLPMCQDTGMACVFIDIGRDAHIDGDIYAAVNRGVSRGYADGLLRKSIVSDPLRRVNSGDNTPAAVYLDFTDGDSVTVTVAPKGFGSENMSRVEMLKPADGEDGVLDFVTRTIELAGANPCPPIIVGVGIGGNFDKVALLAKRALLRSLDEPNRDTYYAELEARLLTRINALGIGPQGFGGYTTALGVSIEAAATHIAGLPCAVNICCHVSRHATAVI